MEISFLTMNRDPNPNYLCETISSLQISDWRLSHIPVNFILGSDNTRHIPHDFKTCVMLWRQSERNLQASFTRNYIRALRYHPGVDVLICEDDIKFSRN